jgi:hypothetical protein
MVGRPVVAVLHLKSWTSSHCSSGYGLARRVGRPSMMNLAERDAVIVAPPAIVHYFRHTKRRIVQGLRTRSVGV